MSEPESRPNPEPDPSLLHEPPHPGVTPAPPWGAAEPPSYYPTASYGPSSSGPSSYGPVGYVPPPGVPASANTAAYPVPAYPTTASERNWAVSAHLTGFITAWLGLGFIGPLVVLFTEGNRSGYVRRHAVEALNFNLSVLIWTVVSAVLVLVLVGILMLLAVGLMYAVASVLGAVAASRGQDFRYPMTIRFVS
jgi:uncharacterized protein